MKKVYWRPRTVSRTALVLIATLAVVGLVIVEQTQEPQKQPYQRPKQVAAQQAQKAFEAIKQHRELEGPPIDPLKDPFQTGLIGLPISPITSVHGVLPAKQASVNPNFAAVVVEMLKEAGVKEGDVVAMGFSGSFPALNICSITAAEALGLEPIIISSASASEWGANIPDLMWIDMERILENQGKIKARSVAVSLGGIDDEGPATEEGMEAIREGVERNQQRLIVADTFDENVDERMEIYRSESGGRPIAAYINVGGGSTSVGTSVGKELFNPGLNLAPPRRIGTVDGVMPRMSQEGVPCIHLVHVLTLAERYGLVREREEPSPEGLTYDYLRQVGEAGVFEQINYQRPIVVAALATIFLALWGFIRTDIGFRLLRGGGGRKASGPPEPMV